MSKEIPYFTNDDDREEREDSIWSEIDWDDVGEAFIGALAANLFVALVLIVLLARRRRPRKLLRT